MLSALWLAIIFLTTLVFADGKHRSFTVDYKRDTFLKDGQPFTFIAGAIHYFKVPRPYWRDRLTKMRAAGVDTLSTYIGWEFHEPSPGQYDFSGQMDFMEFLRIATQLDFNIILRPGPSISAEIDLAGYPAWLLTKDPNIKLRTMDPCHIHYVKRWLHLLMPKIVPLLYGKGGNIIMVQVENEFGFSDDNEKDYQKWLYKLLHTYVQDAAVLCTNDLDFFGVKRGFLPGVLETLDFGPIDSPMEGFRELRDIQPQGPLVVMEFYVGFTTYWGQPWTLVSTQAIVSNIETFLQKNVSFTMYMFHGGTNFAFAAGSYNDSFVLTSYDFDAPISEAGDLTPKYIAIRDTIKKYRKVEDLPALKPKKRGYGTLQLQPVCSLFSCPIGIEYQTSKWPVTFEAVGQNYGFLSYTTTLDRKSKETCRLQATVRDRTTVFLDDNQVGVMQTGEMSEVRLPSSNDAGHSLRLLVENMGRPNQRINVNNRKGLMSNATVDGELLSNWKITGYPLKSEDIAKLNYLAFDEEKISFPAVFRGSFTLGEGKAPRDTFLSMEDWGKGVAFVNNHNLGRYWEIGPQVTMYVPANVLRAYPAPNIVTIVELYKTHLNRTITFLKNPIIKGNFTYSFY